MNKDNRDEIMEQVTERNFTQFSRSIVNHTFNNQRRIRTLEVGITLQAALLLALAASVLVLLTGCADAYDHMMSVPNKAMSPFVGALEGCSYRTVAQTSKSGTECNYTFTDGTSLERACGNGTGDVLLVCVGGGNNE